MFRVGDFVTGKPDNGYCLTDTRSLCVVKEAVVGYSMTVVLLMTPHSDYLGDEYPVDNDEGKFELVNPIDWYAAHVDTPKVSNFDEYLARYGVITSESESERSESMSFNVGDIVTGTPENCYGLTNANALCVVKEVENGESMKVAVLTTEDPDELFSPHSGFFVQSRLFTKVERASVGDWLAEHSRVFKDGAIQYLTSLTQSSEEKGKVTMETKSPVAAPTLMDKSGKYNLTESEMNYLLQKGTELLEEYDYTVSNYGLRCIYEEWERNKGWLINLFKKSKYYKEGKFQIILPSDFRRTLNRDAIGSFCYWAKKNIPQPEEKLIHGFRYMEIKNAYDRLDNTSIYASELYHFGNPLFPISIESINEVKRDYSKFRGYLDEAREMYAVSNGVAYDKRDYDKKRYVESFFSSIACNPMQFCTKELADTLNTLCKAATNKELRAVEGKKISRIVNQFCGMIGLDKVKDTVLTGYSEAGQPIYRDHGYGYQFAMFADAINPLEYKRNVVLSLNPIDYWTMSFGHGWASCHTIDKENKRGGSSNFSGCYSGGTESYMLDESCFIVYTVSPEYDGDEYEMQDKYQRCVFALGEDKLLQMRVYPDGRDNAGDDATISFAKQLREVVQKVIADLYDVANLWVVKKGTDVCREMTHTTGVHYRDYLHYDDCNVSYLKRDGVLRNTKAINIGHNPICPNCGEEHNSEEWITCNECRDGITCARCGREINRDDAIYCEDNEEWYCDSDCASDDGVYYCENDGAWHTEDYCFYDDYDDCYYYGEPDVVTEDGHAYCSVDNAQEAGYRETDSGYWYREDEVHYCEHCGCIVHDDEWNDELECCMDCESEVRAEREAESAA